eukprot:1135382-Amphidinium_carterae.1
MSLTAARQNDCRQNMKANIPYTLGSQAHPHQMKTRGGGDQNLKRASTISPHIGTLKTVTSHAIAVGPQGGRANCAIRKHVCGSGQGLTWSL